VIETFEVPVTKLRPENQSYTVRVKEVRPEVRIKKVPVTVVKTVSEVVTERVPYTVRVQIPYQVKICVPVCAGEARARIF
jgi:hypothetical protein